MQSSSRSHCRIAEGLSVDFRYSRYSPIKKRPAQPGESFSAYIIEDGWDAYPNGLPREFFPSIDWSQGGPIIEREGISVWRRDGEWAATDGDVVYEEEVTGPKWKGPTALIAAMRAYVASKFDNEVPEVG
jgi:hypothetical protein